MLVHTASEPMLGFHPSASSSRPTYTIRDLAHEFGLTLRALRFYEDRGLIAPRRKGNLRIYSAQDRARIAVIVKAKSLGFTLSEIKETLATERLDGSAGLPVSALQIEDQIAHLQQQKADVEAALAELHKLRAQLLRSSTQPEQAA